jgi:hypothetical protein
MPLTIEEYNRAEEDAVAGMSFSEIMAFSPGTFNLVGFPTYIKRDVELARYVDWNRDPGNQRYFERDIFFRSPSVRTIFTRDEAALINRLCDRAVAITGQAGRAVRPVCNPLAQMGLFRIVQALSTGFGRESLSIFEIGPGSGYLGAMLVEQGHRYTAMDNTQALYLLQSRLLEETAPNEFSDWARPGANGRSIARVTHLPWWEFVRLGRACPFKADIVISNANLGEMREDAVRFIMSMAKRLLADSDIRLLLFTSIGDPRGTDRQTLDAVLKENGFVQVFHRNFFGYSCDPSNLPAHVAWLEVEIPLFNPSGDEARLSAQEFLRLPRDQRPLDLDFTEMLEGWTPPVPE